jgi:hypothetical protein
VRADGCGRSRCGPTTDGARRPAVRRRRVPPAGRLRGSRPRTRRRRTRLRPGPAGPRGASGRGSRRGRKRGARRSRCAGASRGAAVEAVHPVGDAEPVVDADVVPGRPGAASPGHQTGVGVEHRQVATVAKGAEQRPLFDGRLGQHGQRLVRVGADDDVVVAFDAALQVAHLDLAVHATHRSHAPRQTHVLEALGEPRDIGPAAALDRPPDGAAGQPQQPVVAAETDEGLRRVVEQGAGGRRPDRRGHRQQMVIAEGLAETLALEEVAERQIRIGAGDAERRLAIEAQDLREHVPEARPEGVAPLGEQGRGGVFEAAMVQRHGERHVGGPAADPEMLEQGDEVRIGGVVEDDEAGVHRRVRPVRRAHLDRVGVAAQAVGALIDDHPVLAGEQPGAGQGRDARADHGDVQPAIAFRAGGGDRHGDSGEIVGSDTQRLRRRMSKSARLRAT